MSVTITQEQAKEIMFLLEGDLDIAGECACNINSWCPLCAIENSIAALKDGGFVHV